MKITHPRTALNRRRASADAMAPRTVLPAPTAAITTPQAKTAPRSMARLAPGVAVRETVPQPSRQRGSSSGPVPTSSGPGGPGGGPDDGDPANPSAAIVTPVSRRQRLVRRLLTAGIVLLTTLIVASLAGLGYLQWRFSQFDKIDIAKGVLDKPGNVDTGPAVLPSGGADTLPGPVTTGVPPTAVIDTTIPAAPSAVPSAVVTTPGDGNGNDDPALSGATATVPPAELPTADKPLVDISGIAAIGGPGAYNTLIIGTDSRADVSDAQARTFGKGQVGGKRSDTIMILRTDPASGRAAVLSLPRDLFVHISGNNKNDRINSAYAKGATTLVQTIKDNFGIPITHVVEVDFTGFQTIVGTLGGVYIDFPKASRDTVTGLNQPAGHNLLTPEQAVAYVRSRHFETGENNKWTSDGRGDLGRVVRQQAFIKAVLQRAIDQGARNPLTANALLANATSAIKLDNTFSLSKLGDLAKSFRSFDPASLESYTVPGTPATIDKKSILKVDRSKASKIVGKFGNRG